MKLIITTFLFVISICSTGRAAPKPESYKDLKAIAFSDREDMSARWNSLMKMTKMKKHESIVDLKRALTSKIWYMRNAGLIALDSINPDLAYEVAKKQLEDPALVVRSAAVDILAKNKKKIAEVRELLWKEIHSKKNKIKAKSLWIRPQIGQYLANEPQANEREKFLTLAEEKDDEVRGIAQKALLKLAQD
jgi:hypothetical protein